MAEHIIPFYKRLSKCLDQEVFSDVAVIATMDGKKIMTHRVVLAAASNYFDTAELQEGATDTIRLDHVSGATLEILIKFCYTQQIVLSATNVRAILVAAHHYRFVGLEAMCEEFYSRAINVQNVLDILDVAGQCDLAALHQAAQSFAHDQFLRIVDDKHFLGADIEVLRTYLGSDDIQINSEEDVFNAICKWIGGDTVGRQQQYGALMRTVRMSQIPSAFLYGRIQEFSVQLNMQQVYKAACAEKHKQDEKVTDAKRKLRSTYMFVAGKERYDSDSIRIERYSIEAHRWDPVRVLDEVTYCNMHCIDNCLFLFTRGYNGNEVMSIPFSTMELERKARPRNVREYFASIAIGYCVYVIGGCQPNTPYQLGTMERYDTRTDAWVQLKTLNISRSNAGVAVLANKIYLIGGRDDLALRCVERYDPRTNTWTIVAGLNMPRAYFRCCTVGGAIFALGGWSRTCQYLSSIERYDEQIDKWTIIPIELGQIRSGFGVGVLGDNIFFAGGWLAFRKASSQLRIVNVFNGIAMQLPSMNRNMDAHCVMTSYHFD